jgi:hypothetical protein
VVARATSPDRYGLGQDDTLTRWRRAGFLADWETPSFTAGIRTVTADQCLQALFLSGDITPERALDLLLQFRVLRTSEGVSGEELHQLVIGWLNDTDQPQPALEFALAHTPEDDASSVSLKAFFYALCRAFSLQCNLAVRL